MKRLTGHLIPFNQMIGLQIISENLTSSGDNPRSYTSYELNLLLNDNNRVNIVDHGDIDHIREHGKQIAARVNVKLWEKNL